MNGPHEDPEVERRRYEDEYLASMQNMAGLTGGPQRKAHQAFLKLVAFEQRQAGSKFFLADGKEPYFLDGRSNEVFPIDLKDDRWLSILGRHDIHAGERLIQTVQSKIKTYTFAVGRHLKVSRFSFYDRTKHALYIHVGKGRVWKLTAEGRVSIKNGTEVFFLDDDNHPVTITDDEIGPHGLLLPLLVEDLSFAEAAEGGMTPECQVASLATWLFMVGTAGMFDVKPMLLVEGEPGSGKTMAIQRIRAVLSGKTAGMVVSEKQEPDFFVILNGHAPIAHIDNLDRRIPWMPDALCAYTTGGELVSRKLHTNKQTVTVKPESWIAASTANPSSFQRIDVLQRSVPIRLKRRPQFTAPSAMLNQIQDLRAALFGEYIFYLQKILAVLPTIELDANDQRMAEFRRMFEAVRVALGREAAWPKELLKQAEVERGKVALLNNPLPDILDRWADVEERTREWKSATHLFNEFQNVAGQDSSWFTKRIANPQALGRELKNNADALERTFRIETRVLDGRTLYRISRQKD